MTQSQQNDSQSSIGNKFFNSLLENIGQTIGKVLGLIIAIGLIGFVLSNHNDLFSFIGFDLGDPRILIPLGASTGLVVFMTTILSTPISVSLGVAILMYLIFDHFNPF